MRSALREVWAAPDNPAWWLDYTPIDTAGALPAFGSEARGEFFRALTRWRWAESNDPVIEQHELDLEADGFKIFSVRSILRILVGKGNASVLETSLRLHPVLGIPMVNGEAIKGAVLATASQLVKGDGTPLLSEQWKSLVFGDEPTRDSAGKPGLVVFAEALWIPSDGQSPFVLEMTNPHEKIYHRDRGASLPPLTEEPEPVAELAAQGTFLFGFRLVSTETIRPETKTKLEAAIRSLIQRALRERGVGAWVNLDHYGRFQF